MGRFAPTGAALATRPLAAARPAVCPETPGVLALAADLGVLLPRVGATPLEAMALAPLPLPLRLEKFLFAAPPEFARRVLPPPRIPTGVERSGV
jgi:hypothetical protein